MKITEVVNLGLNLEETSTDEREASSNSSDGSTASIMDQTSPGRATEIPTDLDDVEASLDYISPARFIRPMAERGILFATRKQVRRLVEKNGESNVKGSNVQKRNRKYMSDIFTTLVDMKWRYHVLLFVLTFLLTWCCFGGVWYVICVVTNDLHHPITNGTRKACVENVFDFSSAFLFSIETQMTIGFGYRVIQPNCHLGVVIMMIQSCIGLFIQSVITGIIFSKISRPKGRAQTIMFSERAAICKRDGEFCLTFRVGDMRKSHIISTSIRALLVRNRQTAEGESIPLCQYSLNLETEASKSDSFVFLIWPVTVVHRIDSTSPLWELSPEKLLTDHFEIIVILEGTVESTGMSTQVRTSYVPAEIMWGERLVPLLTLVSHGGRFEIDYKQFNQTAPMIMPDCCAREYAERREELASSEELSVISDAAVSFVTIAAGRKKASHAPARISLFLRNNTDRDRGHVDPEKND